MAAWGRRNPWPKRWGGGLRPRTLEARALSLTFQRRGHDVSEGSTKAGEAYAFGNAIANTWAISERNRGADIPRRMLETLPTYEEILRTRPGPNDSENARRTVVAAKMRGQAGQATGDDIEDVCRTLLGPSFEGIASVDPTEEYSYWPGMNPGPPGFEWCSNRCSIAILVRLRTQSDAEWRQLIAQLNDLMESLLPGWETFVIGTEDGGFVVNQGIVGRTLL